jgi:hypothetical protein
MTLVLFAPTPSWYFLNGPFWKCPRWHGVAVVTTSTTTNASAAAATTTTTTTTTNMVYLNRPSTIQFININVCYLNWGKKERMCVFTDTNINKRAPKNVRGCCKNVKICFPHRNIVIAFCFHDFVGKSLTVFGRFITAAQVLHLQFSFRKVHTFYAFAFFMRYTFSTHDARWRLVFMYGFIHVGARGSILSMGKRIFVTSECPGQH